MNGLRVFDTFNKIERLHVSPAKGGSSPLQGP